MQRKMQRTTWLSLLLLSAVRAESNPFTATSRLPGAERVTTLPPPPPPPPKLPPIHYSFPQSSSSSESSLSSTNDINDDPKLPSRRINNSTEPRFYSARQDLITKYIHASFTHRIYLTASAALVGVGLASLVSHGIFGRGLSPPWLAGLALGSALLTWLRNNIYSELLRAASFVWLLSWQRWWYDIRPRYPTGRYLYPLLVRGSRRRPFPPTSNTNRADDANARDRLWTLAAVAVLGAAAVPSHIPLLPTAVVRIVIALFLVYTGTLPTRAGDATRCVGQRAVAWLRVATQVAQQVALPDKAAIVAAALLDRALILDRQHRVRQRVFDALTQGVAAVRSMQPSSKRAAAEENPRKERTNVDPRDERRRRMYTNAERTDFVPRGDRRMNTNAEQTDVDRRRERRMYMDDDGDDDEYDSNERRRYEATDRERARPEYYSSGDAASDPLPSPSRRPTRGEDDIVAESNGGWKWK